MKEKFEQWYTNLTDTERKAARVVAICAAVFLAVLVGTIVAVALVSGDPEQPSSGSSSASSAGSDSYDSNKHTLDVDELGDTILKKTEDAGQEYLDETLFIGDSNTAALAVADLLPLEQVSAKVGVGVYSAITDNCCYFVGDNHGYTMVDTIAMMKPRRVIFTFGSNDAPYHTTEEFIEDYREVLKRAEESYPYADIIVNSVYPVAKQSNYPDIKMSVIDEYNQALAQMCKEEGYKFLNSSEVLKGGDGYLKPSYSRGDGLHLTTEALQEVLTYVREHALETEDRRPDTSNIPTRRVVEEVKTYTATYTVEKVDGVTYGTLQGDGFSGVTSKQFTTQGSSSSFTVTAVPNQGYEFVRWSDGSTDATRTDSNLTANLSVTAIFTAKGTLSISADRTQVKADGENVKFYVSKVTGKGDKTIQWFINGQQTDKTGENVELFVKPGDSIYAMMGSTQSNTVSMGKTVGKPVISGGNACKTGESITLTVSGEGLNLDAASWMLDGVEVAKGVSYTFVAPQTPGNFTVSVTVDGQPSDSFQITVTAPDPTPTPAPTPDPVPPDSGSQPDGGNSQPQG